MYLLGYCDVIDLIFECQDLGFGVFFGDFEVGCVDYLVELVQVVGFDFGIDQVFVEFCQFVCGVVDFLQQYGLVEDGNFCIDELFVGGQSFGVQFLVVVEVGDYLDMQRMQCLQDFDEFCADLIWKDDWYVGVQLQVLELGKCCGLGGQVVEYFVWEVQRVFV